MRRSLKGSSVPSENKRWLLAMVIAASTLPLATGHAVEASACPDIKTQPFPLIKIAKDTYVRKGAHETFEKNNFAAIANVSVVIGQRSIAVIDTGGSYCDGKRFLAAIRGLSNKPISHVINTHSHPDHIFGNAAFVEEKPEFLGHTNLPRAIAEKGPHYLGNLQRLVGKERMLGTKLIAPTTTVKGEKVIDLGKRILELRAHPTAHTDHDLTVFDRSTKILWAGDLLFHEHIPVLDGSLKGWMATLETLQTIPAKKVVPGHGGPLLPWPGALTPQKAYFTKLSQDLTKIIKAGGTMAEAQTRAGQAEKRSWLLFHHYNPRNAAAAYAELEWEVE